MFYYVVPFNNKKISGLWDVLGKLDRNSSE